MQPLSNLAAEHCAFVLPPSPLGGVIRPHLCAPATLCNTGVPR